MTSAEKTDLFEFYSRASKYWMDAYNQWARMMGLMPQSYGVDVETWFKPFWGYWEWARRYAGMSEATRSFPFPYSYAQDMNEVAGKSLKSYLAIYNAWLKGIDSITREVFDTMHRVTMGEKPDASDLYEAMKNSVVNLSSKTVESLQGTPFESLREVNRAFKESLESLPEDEIKSFLEDSFNISTRVYNMSTATLTEGYKAMATILEEGSVSGDTFDNLMDRYSDSVREIIDATRIPEDLKPRLKETAEKLMEWSRVNIAVFASWTDMYLKLYQGLARSSSELFKASEETLRERKISSVDDLYRTWSESSRKAMEKLATDTKVSQSVPNLTREYSNWLKSSFRLYETLTTPVFAFRNGTAKVKEEMARAPEPEGASVGARRRARVSATQLQVSLKGLNYPITKDGLINQAQSNSAPEAVMTFLHRLPEREYQNLSDIEEEFGKLR